MQTRRQFLQLTATATGAFTLSPLFADGVPASAASGESTAFFLIGDTHYLGDKEKPEQLDETSRDYTKRLIEWLNKLPGTDLPAEAGGGKVAQVRGLIHAGDMIDSGDKPDATHLAMQKTELAEWLADFGLNGGDGKLPFPVREVHGNHDAPQGNGAVLEKIIERNKTRAGLAGISPNGLHYSWDWGCAHFINLGIVVGQVPGVDRARCYPPMGSLDFLISDLAERVGDSGRPVVITHHVDVARYSAEPKDAAAKVEWDVADVQAYHAALAKYRVAAICYGHTHVRRIFPWDGTQPQPVKPGEQPQGKGIPVFNTAKASHFISEKQALMYFELSPKMITAREFVSEDGWQTAAWTPQVWRFPLA